MRALIAILLATMTIATSAAGAEKMKGKELSALLSNGKEIMLGGEGKGYSGTLMLTKDGKGKGQVKLENGDVIPIEGVWKIKKDRFCRTWKGGRDAGKEVCETWIKTGPKAVEVMVGKENKGNNYWN
jgi:hypothetical protein